MSAPSGLWQCFDFDGAFAQAITNDNAAGTSYGNVVQLNGASELEISPEMLTNENYGDAQILDFFSRIKAIKAPFKFVVNSLAALPILLGANYRQIGTAPNQQIVVGVNTSPLPYFQVDGQCKYIGPFGNSNGDAHLRLAKCKISKWQYKWAAEKRHELSGEFMGLPLIFDDPIFGHWVWKMFENETSQQWTASSFSGSGPAVSTVVPATSATGISTAAPGVVTITFNNAGAPLNPSCITPDNFVLFDQTNDTIIGGCTLLLDSTGFVVTLSFAAGFAVGMTYDLLATGITDIYGNVMAPGIITKYST